MQITSMKNTLLAVSLLAAATYAGNAAAHTYSASIGKAAKATDLYQVSCSDDGNGTPSSLTVSILDSRAQVATPNPQLSIQILKSPKAANATDPAEDAKYSPSVSVVGGIGPYLVMVNHNKLGAVAENYTISYHCTTATGIHTGTQEPPTILQNQ